MSEDDAYMEFRKARWPETDGWPPCCPACGTVKIYETKRRRFRCSSYECRVDFTVTSGTILASHKLSFHQIFCAIAIAASDVKNEAALLLTRQLGISYKSAWVLLMKLREAIAAERALMKLEDVVEIDAMYVGGHVKPANRAVDRVDRRKAIHQSGKRRCVLAMRQRDGRTISVIARTEDRKIVKQFAARYLKEGTQIVSYGHEAYADLALRWKHVKVDHAVNYSNKPGSGEDTNQIESFFSRVRRAEGGTHHRISGRYTDWYVAELAYREDMRRRDNGWVARNTLRRALAHPVSRWLCGYWQGNHPPKEFLWNPQAA